MKTLSTLRLLIFSFLFLISNLFYAQSTFTLDGQKSNVGVDIAFDDVGNSFVIGNFIGTLDFDTSDDVFELSSQVENVKDVFIASYSPSGLLRFAFSISGDIPGDNFAKSISVDIDGNIHITGKFYGSADFDPSSNIFNLTSDQPFYGNAFIASYDNSGNFRHAFNLNVIYVDATDELMDLQTDAMGNIYMTGTYGGIVDFDPGPEIFELPAGAQGLSNFLASYDIDGNFRFAINIGFSDSGNSVSIATDKNGNSYIAGLLIWGFDYDPGPDVFELIPDDNFDLFLASYDTNGEFRYANKIDYTTNGYVPYIRLSIDPDQNLNITGALGGTVDFDLGNEVYDLEVLWRDFFLASYSSDLSLRYAFTLATEETIFDTVRTAIPTDIINDEFGNTYITGLFVGTIDFDPGTAIHNEINPLFSDLSGQSNIFKVSYDKQGEFRFSSSLGNPLKNDNGSRPKIAINGDGKSSVTGAIRGDVNFNDTTNQFEVEDGNHFNAVVGSFSTNEIISSTNEQSLDQSTFSIYPNPTSEKLLIQIEQQWTNANFQIINSEGQVVLTSKLPRTMELDVSNYPKGYYWISIIDEKKGIITKPFIIN